MISAKRISIKFLFVALLFVFISGADACIEREREALLSFKNGLIDYNGILSSWQTNECCKWNAVECSNTTGHVIALYIYDPISYEPLLGEVGLSSLLELHHLNYLSLSYIDFGGNPIPKFIGSMKQLQHLYLRGCNFGGIVPPQLGNLTNLKSLALSYNPLKIENLDWLTSLSLLSHLDLRQIDLSHTNWLQHILRLHSLHELHLDSCNIGDTTLAPPFVNSSSTSLSFLSLSNNLDNLFGNTSEKGILKSLQLLDLGHNKLSGSLPDLRGFSALTEVHLGGNNFTGSIPLSIGQLSELRILDLSNNSLEGVVSESHLIKLSKLKKLDLSLNLLSLQFAPDWSPTFQLNVLQLAGCNVGPSFPKWIQTQKNLVFLDLSGANIADEVPTWLWSVFPILDTLYLFDNRITGTIPNISNTFIKNIDLSNNSISGPIPLFHANTRTIQLSGNMFSGSISSICKTHHGKLGLLDLSNNQLAGEIPNCWEKMPILNSLNLANNHFWGEIPRSLGSVSGLGALQLRGNSISGEFPSTLRSCKELLLVDVAENELAGDIPTWFGELYNMEFLNLGKNKLHGSIPVEICNLTSIRILDLSKNNLDGNIPDCFNNFTSLAQKNIPTNSIFPNYYFASYYNGNVIIIVTHYEYSSIQWKGQESEYRKNLQLLKLIDFSSNRLSGNIPHSFSNMKGLISLNLSSNSFTGNIITNIGEMEMLESLDLSNNQLYGEIPTSLAQLQYLSVLDLSNNTLSGEIPTSTQLQSFNASAYAENDGLCGPPLALCTEDVLKPPTTNPGGNADEKGISLSFMQEVGISMGFGFIFGFWGVVGTFILKKSWRIAFFNLFDDVGDWFYVRIAIFVSKLRRG